MKLDSWEIEKVTTTGDNPGWINRHTARLLSRPDGTQSIQISGGKVWSKLRRKERYEDNTATYELDLQTLVWKPGPAS